MSTLSPWAPNILTDAYRDRLVSSPSFSAALARDEAMLRFPYDERLRSAPQGDPRTTLGSLERVWCVPLQPDQSEALARLFASLPGEPDIDPALARAIERLRRRRNRRECLVDLRAKRRELVAELRHRRGSRFRRGAARAPRRPRVAGYRTSAATTRRRCGAAHRAGCARPRRDTAHGHRTACAERALRTRRARRSIVGPKPIRWTRPDGRYDVAFRRDRRGAHLDPRRSRARFPGARARRPGRPASP